MMEAGSSGGRVGGNDSTGDGISPEEAVKAYKKDSFDILTRRLTSFGWTVTVLGEDGDSIIIATTKEICGRKCEFLNVLTVSNCKCNECNVNFMMAVGQQCAAVRSSAAAIEKVLSAKAAAAN